VLGRLAGSVLRRRWLVLAFWGVVVVAGSLSAGRLPGLLSTSLAVPGTSSERADTILAQQFGQNVEGTFTVVLRRRHVSTAELRELDRDLARAARVVPAASTTPFQVGGDVLYADVGSSLDIQQAAEYTAPLRRSLHHSGLAQALVTGAPALQHDLVPVLARDLRRGEVVAVTVALVLLAWFSGVSLALVVPFAVALCSTAASLGIIFLLAHVVVTALYVPNLVELVGLGLAIDYSLLIVQRFREELAMEPDDVDRAVRQTMRSAGRTVLVSGTAVAVGLSALLLVPVPFVRSLGLAGLVVPLVSILTALTVQPVLLSLLGRRVWRAGGPSRRRPGGRDGIWSAIGGLVVRRRAAVLACSLALLLLASAPIAWLRLTPGSLNALPASLPSTRALDLVRAEVGPGVVTPIEVVVDAGKDGHAGSPPIAAATLRLAHQLLGDPEVYVVAIGTRAPYVDMSGRDARVVVVGRHDFGDEQSQLLVEQLRDRFVPAARFPAHVAVYVGGAPAQGVDFIGRVYGTFPLAAGLTLVVAYLVLLVAVRSILLPLVAVLLDLFSAAAAYGVLVAVFEGGVGADTLHLDHVAQISAWVPVVLFALLFGLSMDYEVFLVSRMRELWEERADSREAIAGGLGRTGGIVSVAALIMVGAVSGLVGGQVVDLQELGVGLAAGVLLDATVVRGLLLPSIMAFLGPASWWLPVCARERWSRTGPTAAGSGRRGRTSG
jgi:RND superfamily putative drug exporter